MINDCAYGAYHLPGVGGGWSQAVTAGQAQCCCSAGGGGGLTAALAASRASAEPEEDRDTRELRAGDTGEQKSRLV